MSDIARVIDAVLRDAIAAPLKADGFRKDGRTWRRVDAEVVRVVQAQASAWNDAASGRFTLNLGVYFPAVATLVHGAPALKRPTESQCLLRQRIGPLMPAMQDHWWTITPTSDRVALAAKVATAWIAYGRPWLETHAMLAAARDRLALQDRRPFLAAGASLVLGERERARKLWRAAVEDAPPALGWLRGWGAAHGLA